MTSLEEIKTIALPHVDPVTPPQPSGNSGELTVEQSETLLRLCVRYANHGLNDNQPDAWNDIESFVASLRADLAGEVERLTAALLAESERSDAWVDWADELHPDGDWPDVVSARDSIGAAYKALRLATPEPTEEQFAEWCQVYWPLSEDGTTDLEHGRQAFRAARAGVRPVLRELSDRELLLALAASLELFSTWATENPEHAAGTTLWDAIVALSRPFARAILEAAQKEKSGA